MAENTTSSISFFSHNEVINNEVSGRAFFFVLDSLQITYQLAMPTLNIPGLRRPFSDCYRLLLWTHIGFGVISANLLSC